MSPMTPPMHLAMNGNMSNMFNPMSLGVMNNVGLTMNPMGLTPGMMGTYDYSTYPGFFVRPSFGSYAPRFPNSTSL